MKTKENWFSISRGGRDPNSHLPRTFVTEAQRINQKAQKKAELKYNLRKEKAADIHFDTLKPIRNKYEEEDKSLFKDRSTNFSLLLHYFNKMEKLEKELDEVYLHEVKQARKDYKTSILTILGHQYLGIPTFPFDLHSMRCRCSGLPNTPKEETEITHKSQNEGDRKGMNKEEFFKFITQKEKWELWELLYTLGMTEEKLTNTLLEYKNELEVRVEGEYTPSGALLTKSITFKIHDAPTHYESIPQTPFHAEFLPRYNRCIVLHDDLK